MQPLRRSYKHCKKNASICLESILVGSASDKKALIKIEVSPNNLVYEVPIPNQLMLKHFQSDAYSEDKNNKNKF